VHLAFDVMVGLGSIACLLTLWYALAWIRTRICRVPDGSSSSRTGSVGSYLGIEAGWITTEVGRQPWIVHNLMRVSDAVNPVDPLYIWGMFGVLLVAYAVIAFFFVTWLFRVSARWRLEDSGRGEEETLAPEEAAPYGPNPE